jgi:hypothetical protein
MKAWKTLWRRMSGQNSSDVNPLDEARKEHIQDLRVLVDQGAAREKEFAGMLRLVMEDRFYRPVITKAGENKTAPVIPADQMQDVTHFDEAADQGLIEQHDKVGRELQAEFQQLQKEEEEYRKDRVSG